MFKRKQTDLLDLVGPALLEKGEQYVYVVDADLRVLHLSRALRELTGLRSDCGLSVHALAGRIFHDKPEYQAAIRQIHDGWSRQEHVRGAELILRGADGSQATVRWNTMRLRQGHGPVLGYAAIGSVVDSATRQWLPLLQRALDASRDAIVLVDHAGLVLHANKAAVAAGAKERAVLPPTLTVAERTEAGAQAILRLVGPG